MTQQTLKNDGATLTIHLDGPEWQGVRAATIGNVAFPDAAAGRALLDQALAHIRAAGRDRVLGPMAGDTWHSYRFVCETDGSPPFLLEPAHANDEPAVFAAAGFAPVSRYFSARMSLAQTATAPAPAPTDCVIEPWDGTDPEALFREVFALSSDAFAANAFYTPITQDAFLAMYRPLIPVMVPQLTFVARRKDRSLAGYLFAIPNLAEGANPKSVILKTYASRERGVGRQLVHACQSAARAGGYETMIHALIHDDNISGERSRQEGGQIFRRYQLLGLRLNG